MTAVFARVDGALRQWEVETDDLDEAINAVRAELMVNHSDVLFQTKDGSVRWRHGPVLALVPKRGEISVPQPEKEIA